MKDFFQSNSKLFIGLGTLMGMAYLAFMIYSRLHFAFSGQLKQYGEIPVILFDLFLALPAILGVSYFYKNSNTLTWDIPFSYFIYFVVMASSVLVILLSNSALGGGLLFIMIIAPIVAITSIYLLTKFFARNK